MLCEPMSRDDHLQRGSCCGNGCLHCPWDFSGKGNQPITEEERLYYHLDDDIDSLEPYANIV